MTDLVFSSIAEQEVVEAVRHYESEVEGLGIAFLDKLEIAISDVKHFPLASRILQDGYRRKLLPRFPYGIIFRIEDDRIFVLAVMHLKRKPYYWLD